MLDIAKEREFIQEVDKRTRVLELEKAKLEQNKAIIEEQKKQVIEKMASLGCTPEDIDSKIEQHTQKIVTLKSKIQSILGTSEL